MWKREPPRSKWRKLNNAFLPLFFLFFTPKFCSRSFLNCNQKIARLVLDWGFYLCSTSLNCLPYLCYLHYHNHPKLDPSHKIHNQKLNKLTAFYPASGHAINSNVKLRDKIINFAIGRSSNLKIRRTSWPLAANTPVLFRSEFPQNFYQARWCWQEQEITDLRICSISEETRFETHRLS